MVGSDLKDIYAIAIGKRAYLLLTALFIPQSKNKMLAQWRMLSIRERPAAAISRESLSILLQTPIFKCLKNYLL